MTTNSIADGQSRRVLANATGRGRIFQAWSDEPWTIDGASVRVAIICLAVEDDIERAILDGRDVDFIFPDLTARKGGVGVDLTQAGTLAENKGVAFQGVVPRGSLNRRDADVLGLPSATFLVENAVASTMLSAAGNPNGRKNSDVVIPYLIGEEIVKRAQERYIVDFSDLSELEASMYADPFEYIRPVREHRSHMNQKEALQFWWRHWNSRPAMKNALVGMKRYIATPRVSKHRVFRWVSSGILADNMVVAITRDDDVIFGILHSRFHELWSLRMCSYLGVGNDPRYTPRTTFETFPFPSRLTPNMPADRFKDDPLALGIADAARALNTARETWLNPLELTGREPQPENGVPLRIQAISAEAALELKRRTLTNLYNQRPSWLVELHRRLDAEVAAAYGWEADIDDDEAIERLLALNLARA